MVTNSRPGLQQTRGSATDTGRNAAAAEQQCHGTTDQVQLLLHAMLFSILWQSCFRGAKAGSVRLHNLVLTTVASAIDYLVPVTALTARAAGP